MARVGFSLLELLIAVAVIGILAMIGIPQYAKFQAKTRQSEAKASLSTLFTAEVSFFGEWTQFTVDLKNAGLGVTGSRLRYITGFAAGTGCASYATNRGAPAEQMTSDHTWSCGSEVNVTSESQAKGWMLPQDPVTGVTMAGTDQCAAVSGSLVGTVSSCDSTTAQQAFVAIAIGDPNANVGTRFTDGWTINQLKSLSNTTPGLE